MFKRMISGTGLAALILLLGCSAVQAESTASSSKQAFSQSDTQGVGMTWTVGNLSFDGHLLALDVLASPSDTQYAACNDVLGDYEDFVQADEARAEGLIPLGFYCEANVSTDSPDASICSVGSGRRKGSEAMKKFRWLLTTEEAAQARSIHLDCGIMETPGHLASKEAYVLDIPESAATTLAQVSINTDQVKTDRIREILITQTDSITNLYIYYDNTDYGTSVPLDFVWSDHPNALVLDVYDEETRLSCHALTLPTAEVDLSNQTIPLLDLENNQLITVDLQTGIAAL